MQGQFKGLKDVAKSIALFMRCLRTSFKGS